MEVVASVIDRVVGLLFTRITKELGYWVCSGNKVKAMKKEMVELDKAAEIIEKQKEDINDVKGIQSSADVSIWLKQFEDIRKEAATIPTDAIGCFNIKMRYKAGKQSSDILENIKSRLKDIPHYQSTGGKILANNVPSNYQASTSGIANDGTQNNLETRGVIFKKALECLESKSSKTQMIALCGMGGVGKSHMMERLMKKVEESRLFYWVVKVVVGQNIDLNALQHALAEKTGGALEETTSDARAERLKNRFAEMSKDGEKKILLILDDLWEEVNLQHIGLTSPLPNGYKLLITSRKTNVCTKMGVDTEAISNIGALSDDEAITLFYDGAEILRDNDLNLDRIIDEIIKRCGKLPIALKLIASTLRGKSTKEAACKVALLHLQRHELKEHYEIVHKAFEISYNDLKSKEEKELFLLSGLFPDDFDIPVEELIWFGWGLKLFSKVITFAEARLQVEIWVEDLISANLLAKSDRVGCLNMHDLARTFALSDSIEVKQASIVNNHDILKQRTQPKSFHRILLKCSGMSEFPKDVDYSDLAFLKVMDGDEQLKIPDDFYKSMEKLKVLSYEGIKHPLLPESTNLTTLCLHGCQFTSDWSAIKNLVQLEVLSFAGSGITELPCEVGKLKNLKLLDLTGCSADLCIDDGVLEGLCSLEELYIKASGQKAISFTKDICEELKVLSTKLSALQVEFFDKDTLPENMSFTKLERFKISVGCLLEEDKDIYSFKNTLKLVTSSSELNRWKINELFEKTEKLHLQVKGMKNLKDVIFCPSQPCFSRLTELEVSDCEELAFLFPATVARAFTTLERLKVSSCRVLETLIHGESGGVIEFRKLKYVSLKELPRLMSLCDMGNRIELPQLVELTLLGLSDITTIFHDNEMQPSALFTRQAQIPKLEKLRISSMEKLLQIWPCEKITTSTKLTELEVSACADLTFLFPADVGSALMKLERLTVSSCRVLNTVIHGESGSVIKFPKLKFLTLKELPRLMSLCVSHTRVELQGLMELRLDDLPSITSIYPDDGKQSFFNPQVEIPMLEKLKIYSMKNLEQIWTCQISTGNVEIVSTVRVVEVKGCDSLVNLFPTNPMPMLNKLEELQVKECGSIDVLFNIDLVTPPNPGPVYFVCGCWPWDRSVENPVELVTPPEANTNSGCVGKFEEVSCSLRSIRVEKLGKLEVLWRINGAKNSPLLSCFQSVENIQIHGCKRFSNISSPVIPNFPPKASVDIRIQDSRDLVFNKALNSLHPDSKTRKIALCGVGKVGKTILMEDLVESAKDLRMSDSVVKLVIGRESDLSVLQETTANSIDEVLKERTKEERAKRLRQIFMQKSQGVKSKILVILDGLWKEMDLEGIGLQDPLPNGIKLLITSRDENVCSEMGVEKSSIFRVPLLEGPEAKVLFYQTLRPSDGDAAADPELQKIAEDVVKICCGMPFLVKEIASYLIIHKARFTWEDAYFYFKKYQLNAIYQKWYEQLETEDAKSVLLLSGSFLEEDNIPVEDLVRYGWGLKLFNDEVDTLAEARQRITNSVDVLICANMLIQSNRVGSVKMYHPFRGFVFSNLTKVKQALIEYDNMLKDAEEPYERILLNCRGLSELPVGFNCRNLRLLKLIGDHEDKIFPHNFYEKMENLEVAVYQGIPDPLLVHFSTNLRTLCLASCWSIGDISFIGNLTNLEILSFVHVGIHKLPSTIGKLKRLKVLDVTGCANLSIDEGVFGGLDKLEELYLRAHGSEGVRFTDTNCDELKILSSRLSALEIELYENMLQPKILSFEKLTKFKISMGCPYHEEDALNTLEIVSNCSEVVECKMNELFEKTERLSLQVKDMKNLEDVSMRYSFFNLIKLEVCDCTDLTFLFTADVADGLRKLEILTVSSCPVLETLIRDENGGGESVIMFPKLKTVSLEKLPSLMSLCDTENRIELPQLVQLRLEDLPNITTIFPDDAMQSFFNPQVAIPNLEILKIYLMEKLKQIWPCQISTSNAETVNSYSSVRVVEVKGCDSLVNLFPTNPMSLLCKLEKLQVKDCGSIEVLFNLDLGPSRNGCWPLDQSIEEMNCNLRSIRVEKLGRLEVLWRINAADDSHLLSCFQSVENIHIYGCERFCSIFTPTTAKFDMRASVDIRIHDSRDLVFNKALNSLHPDNKTRKIALCGVGKVGKTTLMEDLVVSAKDLRMFHSVVLLVSGRESDVFDLQETTAKCIGEVLKERTKEERAKRLRQIFTQESQGVKSKILVILDGLWKEMDLGGIGLQDPLPNGIKLLITSRDENVCIQMGVEKSSIFSVPLLEGAEAKVLFYQALRPSDGDVAADPELQKIAEDVVKICCGMPFLIKEIVSYLTRHEARSTWEDVYFNFKKNHLNAIYQKWYEQLETEDAKAVLLLSGSFPEEADIPVEDLVRYGWGLKLLNYEVDTLAEARQRITNSVDVLIHANMLIRSDHVGSVRMHHPLRGFVFSDLTTVKQASIKYDYTPKAAEEPYERILLNCRGMSELPVGFNYQNLRLLKLMGKKEQLKFPHEFYDRMKNLEVVAYEKIVDPLLPSYSANLRTLCLDACSLADDFSFLGDLINLEILSFARCGMKKLPSTIGKLRKLKLLDVTGCSDDLSVEDGVFRNLVNLEELYMITYGVGQIRFTDSNYEEFEILFRQLCALEFVFYENKFHLKNGSFEKLEKFKISMGCKLDVDIELNNSENILKLVSNRNEVVKCKMNELFEKTERLYLKVKDMKTLEEVSMQYAFCNLRELKVCDCRDLTFLFTVPVADGLRKLESLKVSSCFVLETLIRDESGGGGSVIMFPKLKLLFLKELPRLMSLCDTDNSVELLQLEELILLDLPNVTSIYPDESMQSLFNQQVQIPNLEELSIENMEKLMQIWPCEEQDNNNNNVSMLREIMVEDCDSLVNLFPRNPLPLLNHLEEVYVINCGSIEVIFKMELRGGNINEHTSSLKRIWVRKSENMREIWRIEEGGGGNNNVDSSSPLLITCFQAVEKIQVWDCKRFRDITLSPKNINFDIRASVEVDVS